MSQATTRTFQGVYDRRRILPRVPVTRPRRDVLQSTNSEGAPKAFRELAIGPTGLSLSSGIYGVNPPAMPGLARPLADPALWIAMMPTAMEIPVALRPRRRIGAFTSHGVDAGHE